MLQSKKLKAMHLTHSPSLLKFSKICLTQITQWSYSGLGLQYFPSSYFHIVQSVIVGGPQEIGVNRGRFLKGEGKRRTSTKVEKISSKKRFPKMYSKTRYPRLFFSGLQILFMMCFVIFMLSNGRWPCSLFQTQSALPALQEKVLELLKGREQCPITVFFSLVTLLYLSNLTSFCKENNNTEENIIKETFYI